MQRTYESFVAEARRRSLEQQGFSAVVEITQYMQGSSRMSVMSGREPIRTGTRGRSAFVGVLARFRCGEPWASR